MNNPNIIHLINILNKFGNKYIDSSHQLKRQDLLADVNDYNKALIQTLADDPETKQAYFVPINNIYVFKADKFSQAVRDAGYWLKSHTDYENHVGLAIDRHYLQDSSNVVLDFPHKDCVLQGGMTTEDTKHNVNERFYNDVISAPQIDNMFAPKILCDVKKYDQNHLDGKPVTSFDPDTDNLIVKANNLIALHSLLKEYAHKVKLIYVDPPFNTGNDSFAYNDTFSHSTWLVFMKNRLEVAKEFLTDDGLIFINIDNNESPYLKVLMDEIFGRENYINTITASVNTVSGLKTRNKSKTILSQDNTIHVYAKNKDLISKKELINPQYEPKDTWDTHYNLIVINKNSDHPKLLSLKDFLIKCGVINKNDTIRRSSWGDAKFRKIINKYSDNICSSKFSIPKLLKQKSINHLNHLVYIDSDKGRDFAYNRRRLSFLSKTYHSVYGAKMPSKLLGNIWTDIDFSNTQHEGGVNFPAGKKPERLLKRIISMATSKNTDIVMDFFMGSATTQAVAMKMHRRFIGIEQMNYPVSKKDHTDIYVKRLQNVIKGESHGISRDADIHWQGGGSFVFATFLNKNQKFIQLVQNAKDSDQLDHIYHQMKDSADIRLDVDLKKYESKADNLPREKKRKCLIDMLDKNQLYYNYADIDDSNVRSMISDSDYQFNKSFYDGGDNE